MPGAITFPKIPFVDGPYKGLDSHSDEVRVSYLPDHVIVLGDNGSAHYDLVQRKRGKVGKFSHYG